MLKARPEELTVLLRDVVDSDAETHEMRLSILTRALQELVAGPLNAYGYDELFIETFSTVDRAGMLVNDSFRHAVEATAERADGALHLAHECAELLEEIAESVSDDGGRLHGLAIEWRELLAGAPDADDGVSYASVSEVARHFDVTPQAVYRWIDKGKIAARKRPGGSYRVPVDQFDRMDVDALNAAARPRPESRTASHRSRVVAARPDRPLPVERLDPSDPLAGL